MATIDQSILLEEAKCYLCLGVSLSDAIALALLSRIASDGGGGGGYNDMRAGDYSGGEPDWTPTGTLGQAVDTSTERVWLYYSGAWH